MRKWLIINTALVLGAAAAGVVVIERGRSDAPPASTGALQPEASPKGASKKDGGRSARPIAVESAVARATTATSDFRSIGSLQSDESVQIAAEIAGRVSGIAFTEGQSVEAGAELVRLDDALAQAEVADVQARYGLAQANFDRAQALSRTGNVTGKAQDEAVANFEIARAAVELAKTRLSKHVIHAPFPGRVGIRKLSLGAYIPVGTSIVNLEKIDVLKVDFKLPEMFLPNIGVGQEIEINVDALPGRTFKGEIFAIDPLVDVNGRAIKVRARMENPGLVLRPGLFARILVKGQQSREVVMVPESAIVPRGGETFVYRIENGKATEARVEVGERRNGEVEILQGLLADTAVVTAGQQKLRNGADVEVIVSDERPRVPASGKGRS
jgi:membrane fusion protein (multidrug efflux system)